MYSQHHIKMWVAHLITAQVPDIPACLTLNLAFARFDPITKLAKGSLSYQFHALES